LLKSQAASPRHDFCLLPVLSTGASPLQDCGAGLAVDMSSTPPHDLFPMARCSTRSEVPVCRSCCRCRVLPSADTTRFTQSIARPPPAPAAAPPGARQREPRRRKTFCEVSHCLRIPRAFDLASMRPRQAKHRPPKSPGGAYGSALRPLGVESRRKNAECERARERSAQVARCRAPMRERYECRRARSAA